MPFSFNLVEVPWIPCLRPDGGRVELSLRDTLLRSHELAGLHHDSPLVRAGLIRLLLAVLHRSLGGPRSQKDWVAVWRGGRWEAKKIEDYLDKWKSRFDLFDLKRPFYQAGGFEIPGGETPVVKLAQELASGNNDTLFDHTVEEKTRPVAAADLARWLVASQSFALGGGVGGTSNVFGKHPNLTHAPMVGGVAVFLQGKNLFENLALNLLVVNESEPIPADGEDRPIWECDAPCQPGERPPHGYLDFLTWPSRCVRLLPDAGTEAKPTATLMHYTQGVKLAREPAPTRNPFWGYSIFKQQGTMPVGLRRDRALWRSASALFAAATEAKWGETRPLPLAQAAAMLERGEVSLATALDCVTIGLENDKAKALMWRVESIPVPSALLNDKDACALLRKGLEQADGAGYALRNALKDFCKTLNEGGQEIREQAEKYYWQSLELPFRSFLSGLPAQHDRALNVWTDLFKANARESYERFTDNAQHRSARELEARIRGQSRLGRMLAKLEIIETEEGTDE